jgi:Tol biopolymer transport system component
MKTKVVLAFLVLALTACGIIPAPTSTSMLHPSTATFTFTPEPPKITETATLSTPQEPPACTFPLPQTTIEEAKPEEYSFSEPRIVATSDSGIEIVEWLPNSQRILITRRINGTTKQNIELFNPQTGESNIYVIGNNSLRPVWIERLVSIIYSDSQLISTPIYINGMVDPTSVVVRQRLWLTNGNADIALLLEDIQRTGSNVPHEWVTSNLIVQSNGSRIAYLKNNGELPWRLYSRAISQDGLKSEKLSLIQGVYGGEGVWIESEKMTWRADTSQIFFYSSASPTNHTFVFDIDTDQICSLSFGGWVYFARWSPNGRYLAVIKSAGSKFPLHKNYYLVVLDTTTGKQYSLDSTKIGLAETNECCMHIVDFTWAPDSSHLALIGTADFSGTGTRVRHDRLYLFDFLSGEVENLFPSYLLISNIAGTGLAWSPDGTKLLATCPTESEGRLCLIPVQVGGQ